MSTVLANRVGAAPATKKGGGEGSPTAYEQRAVEQRITLVRTDDERLFVTLTYTRAQGDVLRLAAASRDPLPESPRTIQ